MKFLRSHKYIISAILLIGCFLLVNSVSAAGPVARATASVIGHIVSMLIWIGGGILVVLIQLLIWVSSYNEFVTSEAVTQGWRIIRDVCNMFFILILLIIAFATVLNIEGYSWKKLLPKMLLMAVLINFSKLICGVAIDMAQVVMLTFVNGFRDIGGGNLSDMLGVNQLLNISKEGATDVEMLSVVGTYILGLGYVIVSIGVIVIILFVLVMRMVMLWILVTLSPLAFLLWSLPGTSTYGNKWRSQFTENVVSGPILAFFIWLSFASVTVDVKNISSSVTFTGSDNEKAHQGKLAAAGLSTAGTPEGMLKFVISIGMLMGGVIITKDLGGAAAKAVGKGMAVNNWAKKKAGNAAKAVATNTGRFAAQTSMRGAGNLTTFAGNKWSEKSGGKYGDSLQKSGAFVKSWGADIRKTRKENKEKSRKKTLEKLGMKGETMDIGKEALDTKLGRSIKGTLTMGAGALLMSNPVTAPYGAAIMGVGAGHMGGSLSSKWIGKEVKEYATKKQQNQNINSASKALDAIKDRKIKEVDDKLEGERPGYKKERDDMDEEIKRREKYAESKINAIEDELLVNIRNAKNSNAPQSEIDAMVDKAAIEKANIKLGVDIGIKGLQEQFNEKYGTDKLKIEADIEAKYHPRIEEIKKFKEESELAQKSVGTINKYGQKQDNLLAMAENKRKKQIKDIEEKFADGPAVLRERKIKEINDKSSLLKSSIKKRYDEHRENERSRTPQTKLENRVPKALYATGEQISKFKPNELTINAMKLGSKEFIAARDSIAALQKTDKIRSFEGSYWSTPTGINSQQEKFLALLADNTRESKEAMQNIAKGLNELKVKGSVADEKSQDWLASIMRGIAHITTKKPETKNSYTTIIEILDTMHTDKKVEDFKPKTK
jgi:hypothetical protein